MSQNWVPPDISTVCPEQQAPLTQCSQIGFVYLTLLTQLFGRSIDSVPKNPYSDYQSAVQSYGTSPAIETSIHGPTRTPFGPTQYPYGSTASNPLGPLSNEPQFNFGQSQILFRKNQVASQTLGPVPIERLNSDTRTTGLSPVLQTDYPINHQTKTHSHGPKGSHGFSEMSFYLKSNPFSEQYGNGEFDSKTFSGTSGGYSEYPSFAESNPFTRFNSPEFDYNYLRRSYEDAEVADSKVNEEQKKAKSRKKRQAVELYDFIIVGAGSAGCVVANRLSEVKKWKVLLIEAGPEEPEITSVPSLAPVLAQSSIDWLYRTQPEELTCRGQRGQSCPWFSGKVMGGSSAINYLVYMRGNRKDYDGWADLGNYGWSYRDVLPYFKKSENNQDKESQDTKYHGTGGPLNVERFSYTDFNINMLMRAFYEKKLPLVDFNGERQIGTMSTQTTSKDGVRQSTNVAFIRPVRSKRPNLIIETNAQVVKILINPKKKIAFGVQYFKDGKYVEVRAKKEIILSAGGIGSPKILMLSGIGPKQDLRSLKIPVIKDLSVGKNLQDHTTTNAMLMKLSNKTSTLIPPNNMLEELKYYSTLKNKDGPLSATGPLHITAFIRTELADEDLTVPDIQFHFDGRNYKEFYSDPSTYLATNTLPFAFYDSINVRPILLLPKSRGYVTLNKTHPVFGTPLIYPRFFTDKRDLDTLVAALRFAVTLEDTYSFKDNGVTFIREPVQCCENHKWGTDDYFACLFISYTATIFHPSGTCKMGPEYDENAVVSPRLKVYGVKHLRVADSSIMPDIVRGNTNAPVIMIGEKVSDMIKEDWIHYL